MILVDTTVWIELFRGRDTTEVKILESLILDSIDVCVCGMILTEVLQGFRKLNDCQKAKDALMAFLFLPMSRDAFVKAADIYRLLRSRGITIRKPVDCMIAAVAMEHDAHLLHRDRDFDPISRHCGLKTLKG